MPMFCAICAIGLSLAALDISMSEGNLDTCASVDIRFSELKNETIDFQVQVNDTALKIHNIGRYFLVKLVLRIFIA
jgi:hypothetical protein